MKSFLIKLTLFSVAIAIVDFCWNIYVPEKTIPHPFFLVALFFIITFLFHYRMVRNANARPQLIIRYYMSGLVLRMLAYIVILGGYRFFDKPTLIPFALAFLFHYLVFTVFEVSALSKLFRNQNS